MSRTKLAVVGGLMALLLSACGIQAKPLAGTPNVNKAPGSHAKIDNPTTTQLKCFKQHHLRYARSTTGKTGTIAGVASGLPADTRVVQIGTLPEGPTILFTDDPGFAEALQIQGKAQGAEQENTELVWPNHATDKLAKTVENCVGKGYPSYP